MEEASLYPAPQFARPKAELADGTRGRSALDAQQAGRQRYQEGAYEPLSLLSGLRQCRVRVEPDWELPDSRWQVEAPPHQAKAAVEAAWLCQMSERSVKNIASLEGDVTG